MTLVARDAELAALGEAWRRLVTAPTSGPVVALVSGEAGIGKTTLANAVVARLSPAPGTVLRGAGRPDQPAAHDWAAQALAHLSDEDVPADRLAAHRLLTHDPACPPRATTFPPRALLRAGVDLVRHALGSAPGVLVAEDLHALDPASLTLIGELARTMALPALIIATTRDVEQATEPHLLAEVLAILSGRPDVVRLHLRPFTVVELATLLEEHQGHPPDPAVTRAVHRRSGGNPFWVGELLAAAGPADLADVPLPRHLASLVRARLTDESDEVRRVAGAAALLGDRVAPDQLAEVCGLTAGTVQRAVDRLMIRGLLVADAPADLRFRHELAREAIAADVLPTRRTQVHRRALDLAVRRRDDAAVARHASAMGANALAAGAALRAARHDVAAGRPEQAHQLAVLGLAALGRDARAAGLGRPGGSVDTVQVGPANGDDHWPLLLALTALAARAAEASGAIGPATAHGQAWLALYATAPVTVNTAAGAPDVEGSAGTDADGPAAAHRLLAGLAWRTGRLTEQWHHLDQAQRLSAPDSHEWVRSLAARAQALSRAERNAEAVDTADKALAAAAATSCPDVEPALLVDRGTALGGLGDVDTAVALLEEARRRAERAHDVTTQSRALNNLLAVSLWRLPADAAWRLHTEVTVRAEALGAEASLGKIARSGVDLATRNGDLERAWSIVWRRLPVEVDPVERVVLAVKAGLLALERGDDAVAARLLRRCVPDADLMEQPWVRTYVALLRVAVAARTGSPTDTEAALAAYRDCVPTTGHLMRPERVGRAVCWALAGGVSAAHARAVLDECLPDRIGYATVAGSSWRDRALARAESALRAAEGDDAGAVVAARDCLAGASASAPEDAEVHLRLAGCLDRLGRREDAESHARQAVELLADWPGFRQRHAIRYAARLAGPGPTTGGPTPLSGRELEVLAEICRGRTNQQIGRALGISARTVAVHVSSVLTKTDCASRTEVALWAVREGLVAVR